jgi:hypothetical protein
MSKRTKSARDDEPVVTTSMFTGPEQSAWQVAVNRGLDITAADLRALIVAACMALDDEDWRTGNPAIGITVVEEAYAMPGLSGPRPERPYAPPPEIRRCPNCGIGKGLLRKSCPECMKPRALNPYAHCGTDIPAPDECDHGPITGYRIEYQGEAARRVEIIPLEPKGQA